MNLNKSFLKSKLHISCLNYKDTIVNAIDLYQKIVYLEPKIFVLNEVVLKKITQVVEIKDLLEETLKNEQAFKEIIDNLAIYVYVCVQLI